LDDRARHADPGRERVLARVPRRADAPRRQDLDDLRRHLRNPAVGYQPGDLGHADPVTSVAARTETSYKEVELHGHTVGYQSMGDGPLLILLQGITSNSDAWRDVMPRLAERSTVIAPDLLGHGRSAKPKGDYSLGAFAAGVRDLLPLLGPQRGPVGGTPLRGGR